MSDFDLTRLTTSSLSAAAREAVEFVDPHEWGAPPQLFAFVPTALLAQSQPEWAEMLDDAGELTLIEQEPMPFIGDRAGVARHAADSGELAHILAHTTWPDEVVGCALVQEVVTVPPSAGEDADAAHPEAREVRMVAAVLRDGRSTVLLQPRPAPESADNPFALPDLLIADGMAPSLTDALVATFEPDEA